MTPLDPHITLVAAAAIAGWLMTSAGLGKNALERKRNRRPCLSCGRHDCAC